MRHVGTRTPLLLEEIATGRVWPIPQGGDENDDGEGGQTDPALEGVEVPEGYRVVSDEAWSNVKSAADRKTNAERVARENKMLRAGVSPETLESDEGKALLDSNMDDDVVVKMAQRLDGGAGDEGAGEAGEEGTGVEDPQLQEGEESQSRERQRLAQGAQPDDGQNQADPYETAKATFDQALARGAKKDVALGQAIGEILTSEDPRTNVQSAQVYDGAVG